MSAFPEPPPQKERKRKFRKEKKGESRNLKTARVKGKGGKKKTLFSS
jgi:hypothetical protein